MIFDVIKKKTAALLLYQFSLHQCNSFNGSLHIICSLHNNLSFSQMKDAQNSC